MFYSMFFRFSSCAAFVMQYEHVNYSSFSVRGDNINNIDVVHNTNSPPNVRRSTLAEGRWYDSCNNTPSASLVPYIGGQF